MSDYYYLIPVATVIAILIISLIVELYRIRDIQAEVAHLKKEVKNARADAREADDANKDQVETIVALNAQINNQAQIIRHVRQALT